jgi:small conductance mechanosensitive channel
MRGGRVWQDYKQFLTEATMNISADLQQMLITVGLRIAGAAAVLLVGRWLAGLLQHSVGVLLKRTPVTPALAEILTRSLYYVILLIAFITALVVIGVPAEILLAALAIMVVVAVIALRESLRDLAATVNFVVFQPFKAGDIIQTNGVVGMVQEILLFETVLITPDNFKTYIPNGNIQNNTIVNLTALPASRLSLSARLNYTDDVLATKTAILAIARADARVLETPAPVVDIMELGESQVEYVLRLFAKPNDLWELQPALNERIKLLMEQRQLAVPVPQLQLHTGQSVSTN